MKKRKKKSLQDIPLADYVVFSIKMLIIFTIIVLVMSAFSIMISDTLISCFFAAFGGEFLVCGLIKIFKLKDKDVEGIIPESSVSAIGFEVNPPYECEPEPEIEETIIGFKSN